MSLIDMCFDCDKPLEISDAWVCECDGELRCIDCWPAHCFECPFAQEIANGELDLFSDGSHGQNS